ncbi:hypothetical protein, partial [Xanthomonas dyei]|uniref:hypothetical protein n=1 Tax=Xanthomonas dyei TaxID=743699 RepID=UPI001B803B95
GKTLLHIQSPRDRELDSKLRCYSKLGGRRASRLAGDAGFIGPRIGNSGYITAEEFAQASFQRYQDFVNEGYDRALIAESKEGLNNDA